ncbi:hypothetical protein Athai_62360 [Actinocatenispora thailandica]|uniref:Helix-turn-helix domain-containing protein n=1 Tax=Actinocatenispora thailandica TaxID=227318 RepID=A0A7R7HZX7_9ACTN|nr:helix-turn-helix domain-containing protein [Actinocatenispora thailandica]BCJ38733.1 hypothetical protein Athai_62360 [Actinocatenispora thailandica]
MSIEALSYVLSLDVGHPTRKLILLGYANHVHADGTASYAKPATIARYANCSERTVQRHLDDLLRAGLLREGDQRLVDHLPRHGRPIVYDVAMSGEASSAWAAAYRPGRRATAARHGARGGRRAAENRVRGDTVTPGPVAGGDNTTPRAEGPEPQVGGGDDLAPQDPGIHRGDTATSPGRGDTALSPEPSPFNRPSSSPTADAEEEGQPYQRSASAERLVSQLPGPLSGHQRRRVAAEVAAKLDAGWPEDALRTELVADVGSARSKAAVYLHRLNALPGCPPYDATEQRASRPEHCGTCEDRTRFRETPDGRPYPCPACHPVPARRADGARVESALASALSA